MEIATSVVQLTVSLGFFFELKATPDTSAGSSAKFILEIFGYYGIFKELIPDQGTQFNFNVTKGTIDHM